jgi:hypothetical protein
MIRVPKKILKRLHSLREKATMETASFGFKTDKVTLRDGRTMTYDDFIKGRTAPFRHSYMLTPLDEIIAWAEGKDR